MSFLRRGRLFQLDIALIVVEMRSGTGEDVHRRLVCQKQHNRSDQGTEDADAQAAAATVVVVVVDSFVG